MTKREQQLSDYINDELGLININIIKDRIEFINKEIRSLDQERFYLMAKLFNLQNKQDSNQNI